MIAPHNSVPGPLTADRGLPVRHSEGPCLECGVSVERVGQFGPEPTLHESCRQVRKFRAALARALAEIPLERTPEAVAALARLRGSLIALANMIPTHQERDASGRFR